MNNKDEARMMLEGGILAEDVALELGIAQSAVYRLADTVLAEKRAERNKLIVAAYKNAWPIKAITDKFTISKSALYHILKANNVPTRLTAKVRMENCDEVIVKLYERGASIKTIREWTNSSSGYIYSVLDREDIPRRRPRCPRHTDMVEALSIDNPDDIVTSTGWPTKPDGRNRHPVTNRSTDR